MNIKTMNQSIKIVSVAADLNLMACGVSEETPEDRGQLIIGGEIGTETAGTANGPMVLWENEDGRPNPPDGIECGIEFEFDLKAQYVI